MIRQNEVKEIGRFIDTFFKVFSAYTAKYSRKVSRGGQEPIRVAYKVTGAIDGYLTATNSGFNNAPSNFHQVQSCFRELRDAYYTSASELKQMPAIALEAIDTGNIDGILYSARKMEPQLSIKIAVNNCRIEFYAISIKHFAEKELPIAANQAVCGIQGEKVN